MSVIAKGVNFPEACIDCPFAHLTITDIWRCSCLTENGRIENLASKLNNCPLVEIPIEHGRLIDENEALINYAKMPSMPAPEILAVTKTIIPSEGDKK